MTTQHALQKIARRLHRSLFQSVPNTGPREVDLSRLKPVVAAYDLPEYSIEIDVQFSRQAMQSLETILPTVPYEDRVRMPFMSEPWDRKDSNR